MQLITRSVAKNELKKIIDFDNRYLIGAFIETGIPKKQLPPPLILNDLDQALCRCDTLEWVLVNNELAGYYWFELKQDHLYIAGLAIGFKR